MSGGVGILAPLSGYGTQGASAFRGELFWATETQSRFRAKDNDGEEMLGTTDKDPQEKVWYECDFIDVLRGASIVGLTYGTFGSVSILSTELVSNGEVNHLGRTLVSGVGLNETAELRYIAYCSDGSIRKRTLKIRGRSL